MCPRSQDSRLRDLYNALGGAEDPNGKFPDSPGIRAPLLCTDADPDNPYMLRISDRADRINAVAEVALSEMMQADHYHDALWNILRRDKKLPSRDADDVVQTLQKIFEPWKLREHGSPLSDQTVKTLKQMARERGLSGCSKLKKTELIARLNAAPFKDSSQGLRMMVEEDYEALYFGGRWEVIAAIILEWGLWGTSLFSDKKTRKQMSFGLNVCYPDKPNINKRESSRRLANLALNSISIWSAICRGEITDIDDNKFYLFDIPCLQGHHEFHSLILIPSHPLEHTMPWHVYPGDVEQIEIPGSHLRRIGDEAHYYPFPLETPSANIIMDTKEVI